MSPKGWIKHCGGYGIFGNWKLQFLSLWHNSLLHVHCDDGSSDKFHNGTKSKNNAKGEINLRDTPLPYVLIHERTIKWTWVPVALFPTSIPMMGVYELLGIAKYGSVVSNHMPIMFIPHTVTIMESGAFCCFAV